MADKNQPGSERKEKTPYIEPTYELNPNQELFCLEYLKDRNQTKAYIRAGYAVEGARTNAARLIANDYIKARINELLKEQIDKIKIEATYILKGILKRAEVNLADAFTPKGKLKPINEMPEHLQRAIIKIAPGKFGKTIEVESGLKALELLGKHLKMFTDVHEIPGLENLAEQIKSARKRAENARSRTGTKTTP